MNTIAANVTQLLREIPSGVQLVAVAKTRSAAEVAEAIAAGIRIVGQNYLQEALPVIESLRESHGDKSREPVSWHFIGHLQSNKIGPVINNFQMIETLESVSHARRLQNLLVTADRVMPVLVEINSGREESKKGLLPEAVPAFLDEVAALDRIAIKGLMTMGPWKANPQASRQAFRDTYALYRQLTEAALPGVEMELLSMGMSASWRVAVEEGANMVRIGADIFGPRR
ncbi:MAG: YggS family pyridoxal phosphate-dependent enzyme [Candidatus Delongbacteria bacterium]|nr:YggS family pyridoxal phosphate-dependent enzyme [Candidatus Delongbacteria bacterium]